MEEKKKFKVCPECGSTNVTIPPAGMDVRLTVPDYCKDCKNKGVFPEVDENTLKEFRKSIGK